MIPFELAEPTSLTAAIKLLDPDDETIRPIAGGTALMLMMKAGVFRPAKLVSLRKIESQYATVAVDANGLSIGAMTTLSDLERSAEVRRHAPLITRTLLTLSNVRVRNVATVGGAMAHGDPHMDLPPVLMALGATLTITGTKGQRSLPVEDLFSGYYETVLARDELITSVQVPTQRGKRAAYMKVTTGSVDDWPALGVAVVLEGDANAAKSVRIVASAATEKATRLKSAEAVLNGNHIDAKLLQRAADAAAEEAEYVSDVRGSVPYKRELMRVYVQRAVHAALDGNGSALMATIEKPGTSTKAGSQIGRSVPRTEGRDKVTGRAEYVHTMRLPGMLVAKIFRSTVAHGLHQIDRHKRGEATFRACCMWSPSMTSGKSFRIRITVLPSTISRSWRTRRCGLSASRSPLSLPAIRMSPSRRCSSSPWNTRNCRPSLTKSRP